MVVVLQPCYVRDGHIVVDRKASTESMTAHELRALFQTERAAVQVLNQLHPLSFFGFAVTAKGERPFVLTTPDLTGNIKGLLKSNPLFVQRIHRVYQVVSLQQG